MVVDVNEIRFIIHMSDDYVVWRSGDTQGDYKGLKDSYYVIDSEFFNVTSDWYYELSQSQMNEAIRLIEKSDIERIELIH